MLSLAALSGVAPERSKTQAARQRRMPDRLSWAPAVISLAELSGVAPERSDTRAARLRRMPDRLSRAPEAPSRPAINMAAVRAVVDEKRRAMSPADWAKATDDGAMIARGLRALKTLPDPQAAMPAFRRKMAEVGVAESAIASIPRTWDPRLADVVIAAHGEMGKLPVPPSRAPGTFTDRIAAAISGDDRMGDTDFDDGAAYLIGSIARAPQDAYSAFFRAREQRLVDAARERGDTSPPIVDAGPPTDEPIDTEEMYKRLKFDPNGPHYAREAAKNPIAGAMSYFSKESRKLQQKSWSKMALSHERACTMARPMRSVTPIGATSWHRS